MTVFTKIGIIFLLVILITGASYGNQTKWMGSMVPTPIPVPPYVIMNPDFQWSHSFNWTNGLPGPTDTVIIDGSTGFPCFHDINAACAAIFISAGNLMLGAGDTLTVYGNFIQTGGNVFFGSGRTTLVAVAGRLSDSLGMFGPDSVNVHVIGGGTAAIAGITQFFNLTVSANVSIYDNVTVDNTFTLNGGNVRMNEKTLTLDSNATTSWVDGYVHGTVNHTFADTGVFIFPTGSDTTNKGAGYVALKVTGGSFPATVAIRSYGDPGPAVLNANHALARCWNISVAVGAISRANLTFEYQPADVHGDESNYFPGHLSGPGWDLKTGGTRDIALHTVSIDSVSDLPGFWSAGEAAGLPLVLSQFTAFQGNGGKVELLWKTVSETNLLGFSVQRRCDHSTAYTTVSGMISAAGTSLEQHEYAFTDTSVSAGKYYYRLTEVDLDGAVAYLPEIMVTVNGVTGMTTIDGKPLVFGLDQNYPNPFNPTTNIGFRTADFGFVTLKIFDPLGRAVATLVNGWQDPGEHHVRFDGLHLPSGEYFYRLDAASASNPAGHFSQTRKMLLIR